MQCPAEHVEVRASGACECPHLEFDTTGTAGHTVCLAARGIPPLVRDGAEREFESVG